jgi:hypothetical protein
MSRIKAYLDAAHTQQSLITKYRSRAIPRTEKYSANMIQAFIHVHLYFICWAAIRRMLEVLRRTSGLDGPSQIYKKYRATLESYAEARHHLEHYEERLPGGKKSQELANSYDYGNLQNGYFSLGGFRWSVNKDGLKILEAVVAELTEAITKTGKGEGKADN